ncbi:MAG: class I SAM-dependent methyltransferase [Polyangiaceae bacterium]|nr:class I SAM-dependent methyltransferase [Polyangiaceae bacterium]
MPELYQSPLFYQRLFGQRVHDVAFYRWLAQGQVKVLELGAGSGRISLPLLEDGVHVRAVERAPEMLRLLEEQAVDLGVRERLTSLCVDFRDFELGERLSLAICPFNALAHLHTEEDLRRTLGHVERHLEPRGALVCDVLRREAHHDAQTTHLTPYFEHPESGVPCRVLETLEFNAETNRLRIQLTLTAMRGPEHVEEHTLDLRFWSADELAAAGDASGLELTNHGNLGDSDLWVLRKP